MEGTIMDTEKAQSQDGPEVRAEGPFSFGVTAATMYDHLSVHRETVIARARSLAAVTIPAVFPPEGYIAGDFIGESNQSIGAGCVNTLASKLMFMAFPPDRPVLRFEIIEHMLRKELDANPKLSTEINIGLSNLEQEHRKRLETTNMRSTYVGATKALLVGGNICWSHLKVDHPVFYVMTHYVVQRNSEGAQLAVIVKQSKYLSTMDKDHAAQVMARMPHLRDEKTYERQVDVYMVCRRVQDEGDAFHWEYWEECDGAILEGTDIEVDGRNAPPLYAAWMVPCFGQNWGTSYCEQYEGDLLIVEGHSASLNDGSSAASLLWLFLKPGSRTPLRTLQRAGNMSMHIGDGADITVGPDLSQKARDFAFVENNLTKAEKRLARAFLLLSSVQRDAERVTAEEFNRLAQELNEATGGMYAENSQNLQRHVVGRFVLLHNDSDKQLPTLDPKIFRVAVITGIEASGRTVEGETLLRTTGAAMEVSKGAVAPYIDWHDWTRKLFMANSISQDGLIRTPEAQAQFEAGQKQDMAKQTMLEKGVGPAVQAAGKMMPQMMPPQGAPEEGAPMSPFQPPQAPPAGA